MSHFEVYLLVGLLFAFGAVVLIAATIIDNKVGKNRLMK